MVVLVVAQRRVGEARVAASGVAEGGRGGGGVIVLVVDAAAAAAASMAVSSVPIQLCESETLIRQSFVQPSNGKDEEEEEEEELKSRFLLVINLYVCV